jgi:rod shape-determining protein MreD
MTRETLILAFRFVFLVLLQTLLLNNIYFFGYINPNLYILFVFLYPIKTKRSLFLVVSFLLGLSIDLFSNTGGLNAAATLLSAYVRFPILKLILNSKDTDFKFFNLNQEPFLKVISYVAILTFIHHLSLFSLEYFNIKEIRTIFHKTTTNSIFTILLIIISIYLTKKKSNN